MSLSRQQTANLGTTDQARRIDPLVRTLASRNTVVAAKALGAFVVALRPESDRPHPDLFPCLATSTTSSCCRIDLAHGAAVASGGVLTSSRSKSEQWLAERGSKPRSLQVPRRSS